MTLGCQKLKHLNSNKLSAEKNMKIGFKSIEIIILKRTYIHTSIHTYINVVKLCWAIYASTTKINEIEMEGKVGLKFLHLFSFIFLLTMIN